MRLDYGTVTSVLKDSAKGAQLCHVKSHSSDREYQFCEVIVTKGISSLPKKGDLVLLSEMHNSEIVVLGVLPQSDLGLAEGEVFLYNGDQTATLKLYADGKVQVTGTGGTITLEANGNLTVTNTGNLTINTTGTIQATCDFFHVQAGNVLFEVDGEFAVEADTISMEEGGGL